MKPVKRSVTQLFTILLKMLYCSYLDRRKETIFIQQVHDAIAYNT
jgi:hypothetical protein